MKVSMCTNETIGRTESKLKIEPEVRKETSNTSES